MKKIFSVALCIFALICVLIVPSSAYPQLVVDDADLLTDMEQLELGVRLDQIKDAYHVDVVVATTLTTEGKTPMAYADDFFDYNGYGEGVDYDGVLLLISMEDRDWWISTCGSCVDMFDSSTIESIGERIVDDLSMGDYLAAFLTFADECDYIINGELNGYPFPFFTNLMISLVAGFVIALIVVSAMRAQLKSVRAQSNAGNYVKSGSMKLTQSNEFYLYRTVTRVKRETESDKSGGAHVSSSGRTHGGGGGKF